MSHRRELLPGTWVLGATISADELNALDLANSIRHTLCFRAIDRQPPDVCHHCGAPSPGDVCRYCNTVHRRITT